MSLEVVGWIIIPLVVFVLTTATAGFIGLIKFVRSLEKSQNTQTATLIKIEDIAQSNRAIEVRLDRYIEQTNGRVNSHDVRIAVLEAARHARDD